MEYMTAMLSATMINLLMHSAVWPIIVVFLIRTALYMVIRYRIPRIVTRLEYIRLVSFFMEVLSILFLHFKNVTLVTSVFYITIFCHLIHMIAVYFRIQHLGFLGGGINSRLEETAKAN